MSSYKEQVLQSYADNLAKSLPELPRFVGTFLNGISQTASPSTRNSYMLDIRVFLRFLQANNPVFQNKPLKDIDLEDLEKLSPEDIDEYIAHLSSYRDNDGNIRKNGKQGIKRKLVALSSMYNFLNKRRLVSANPMACIDLPRIEEETINKDYLTHDEIAALISAIETGSTLTEHSKKKFYAITMPRDLAIVTLLLSTGIRISELCGLNVSDINWDHPDIDSDDRIIYTAAVVRKGNQAKADQIMLTEECMDVLRQYMENSRPQLLGDKTNDDENALFLSLRHKRISVDSVEVLIKKYAAVIPQKYIHAHSLRKTRGSQLYNATGDLYLTAEVLGHKSVEVTRRHYTTVFEDRKKKAAYAGQYIRDEE